MTKYLIVAITSIALALAGISAEAKGSKKPPSGQKAPSKAPKHKKSGK